jgi:hypothetical protein
VVKDQRMKIETSLQSLEVGLKSQELQLKVKAEKIGETKICLKINKQESMKLKSKERSLKMAKKLKSTKKVSMYVKRLFEHLLKKKEKVIQAKLTTLTCSSSTLKKVALVNLQFLDEASPTPAPTSPWATAARNK